MTKMKIGDLFELEKGSLQSSKCIAGQYDFITASKEWKTHNEFSHDTEALIFAAMASGSLGQTHYVNGKFITSDLCYILTPKDNEKYPINLKFYHFVFNSLRDEIVKNTKSGTSKESINQTNLKKYEIPYFDIEQQNIWIERLLKTKSIKENLISEIETQQTLLKKLRQSILQEAIEGKLTASWREKNPDVESASILLEKIKSEKEQLIKEKKIKKQKPLQPINEGEIPFEIPEGWKWCRLGQIGYTFRGKSPKYDKNSNIFAINQKCVRWNYIDLSHCKNINEDWYKSLDSFVLTKADDILVNSTGEGTIGRAAIVHKEQDYIYDSHVLLFRSLFCKSSYIMSCINSTFGQEQIDNAKGAKSTKQTELGVEKLNSLFIPLPPLEEQKEIVKKIENLFAICDELETQIEASKKSSQTLMQAVLKEAFEG